MNANELLQLFRDAMRLAASARKAKDEADAARAKLAEALEVVERARKEVPAMDVESYQRSGVFSR